MKNITKILLVVVSSCVLLSGCGENPGTDAQTQPQTKEASVSNAQNLSSNTEVFKMDGLNINLPKGQWKIIKNDETKNGNKMTMILITDFSKDQEEFVTALMQNDNQKTLPNDFALKLVGVKSELNTTGKKIDTNVMAKSFLMNMIEESKKYAERNDVTFEPEKDFSYKMIQQDPHDTVFFWRVANVFKNGVQQEHLYRFIADDKTNRFYIVDYSASGAFKDDIYFLNESNLQKGYAVLKSVVIK